MSNVTNIAIATLEGNLVRDAELKQIGQTALCTFSMAVNSSFKDKTDVSYFDLEIWGKFAESVGRYLSKGTHVVVTARPKQDRWEDKDGGGKRSKVKFRVDQLRMIGSREDRSSNAANEGESIPDETTYDDDIPF